MEYVDATFPGPSLRPADPEERWRMRWWMKFFDQYFGPSLSMIGWSVFVGPSVRNRDPAELKAAIDRIPLKERRIAWSKAIYNTFSKEELDESRRRTEFGTRMLEKALSVRPWVAGKTFSLADVNGFNLGYALPLARGDICNDEKTPHILEWLRKIYERPATKKIWAMGRTQMAARVTFLERKPARGGGKHDA
jgi:glutathione S-transferase/GST-like protein